MATTFVKGDLFAHTGLDALAHGCNCAGAMGKGIAVRFRERFPKMYEAYKERCADGRFALGDVFAWPEDGLTIFNLGTQKTWRTKADLSAIETAVRSMVRLAEQSRIARVGLPRIGAGLGGLAWPAVRALLAEIGNDTHVELVVFEEYEAKR
jgi:O-acetyl-ADP-ribose deacetylase (regulator of RNase III)